MKGFKPTQHGARVILSFVLFLFLFFSDSRVAYAMTDGAPVDRLQPVIVAFV